MSSATGDPHADSELTEEAVRRYLERHPEFFARHADLLEQMSVPHSSGAAESLIERQVSMLRSRNARLDERLRGVIDQARRNEGTSERLHRLGLDLLECRSPGDLLELLERRIRAELGVEASTVRVFLRGSEPTAGGCAPPQLSGASMPDACRTELYELRAPRCGPLPGVVASALLGWPRHPEASGVMLPFELQEGRGAWVLACRDPRRFEPDMGTLFLQRLASVLGAAIDRCLGSP